MPGPNDLSVQTGSFGTPRHLSRETVNGTHIYEQRETVRINKKEHFYCELLSQNIPIDIIFVDDELLINQMISTAL